MTDSMRRFVNRIEGAGRKTALFGVVLALVLSEACCAALATPPSDGRLPIPVTPGTDHSRDLRIAQGGSLEVMPYRWSARKSADGSTIITGYVPSGAIQARLLERAGARALDASSVADGEPEGFAGNAETALAILAELDEGAAELLGTDWRLSGGTSDAEAAARVRARIAEAGLADNGWQLDLTMPELPAQEEENAAVETDGQTASAPIPSMPFSFAVMKRDSAWLVGGNAPIAAFQRYLEAHFDIRTSGDLVVMPAPEGFPVTAVAGMEALTHLQDGRLFFNGTTWYLSGVAADGEQAEMANSILETAGIEAAIAITEAVAKAPSQVGKPVPAKAKEAAEPETAAASLPLLTVHPYHWSAEHLPDGSMDFAGYVPAEAMKRYLGVKAGPGRHDNTALAAGAPADFAGDVLAGLDALTALDFGHLDYDGSGWTLSGRAASGSVKAALLNALGPRADAWSIEITTPEPVPSEEVTPAEPAGVVSPAEPAEEIATPEPQTEPSPLPVAEPFLWSAERLSDGSMVFSGNVPTEAMKSYLGVRAGPGGRNDTTLAAGAPEGFAGRVVAGLDALTGLDFGRLAYDGSGWMLSGVAASDAEAEKSRAALKSGGIDSRIAVMPAVAETPPEKEVPPPSGKSGPAATEPAKTTEEPPPAETEAAAETVAGTVGKAVEPEPQIAPQPLLTIHPYRWSAERVLNGRTDFDGYVPTEVMKRYLGIKTGPGGYDNTTLAAGAPADFAGDVLAGLDALKTLDFGRLVYGGYGWTLAGRAASEQVKASLLSALGPRAETWSIEITTPEPPPIAVDRGAPDYVFSAEKRADGTMELTGDVPAEAMRAYLGVVVGPSAATALTVRPDAPPDFVSDVVVAIPALKDLDSGRIEYGDFTWRFNGKAFAASARDAAQAQLATLADRSDWTIGIAGPSPLEVCSVELAAFDERNAILFEAGSARISKESVSALDEIASDLSTCPDAFVHVEGHTDSDGDEESNLILSVSRAEAVVDRLIELGINEKRLYAIGFGESLPIATNDTNDGKRRNRRIVFSVTNDPDTFD